LNIKQKDTPKKLVKVRRPLVAKRYH